MCPPSFLERALPESFRLGLAEELPTRRDPCFLPPGAPFGNRGGGLLAPHFLKPFPPCVLVLVYSIEVRWPTDIASLKWPTNTLSQLMVNNTLSGVWPEGEGKSTYMRSDGREYSTLTSVHMMVMELLLSSASGSPGLSSLTSVLPGFNVQRHYGTALAQRYLRRLTDKAFGVNGKRLV